MIGELWFSFQAMFLPVIAGTLAIGLLVLLVSTITRRMWREDAPFLFGFAFLGSISGLVAGVSREPIVGALLTGLLGLMSGLLSYMFTLDRLEKWRPIIPYTIVVLMLATLYGLSVGGLTKKRWDGYQQTYAVWLIEHERVHVPVMRLRALAALCEQQLPLDKVVACKERIVSSAQ